jgi:uncharacterized protein (DUF2062 family)
VLDHFRARALALWRAALHERASPAGIGWAIAVGVFAGCTPFVGFHAGIAVVFATLVRVNRVWAVVGSRVSFFLLLPWIALAEIQAAHRLRTGSFAPLLSSNVLEHGREWLTDWMIGTPIIGIPLATALGTLAYALARRRVAQPPT